MTTLLFVLEEEECQSLPKVVSSQNRLITSRIVP